MLANTKELGRNEKNAAALTYRTQERFFSRLKPGKFLRNINNIRRFQIKRFALLSGQDRF
ncbi:hypothetical protein Cflav_PD5034 [Pedosphaera parvula Ellin514]|uniref:Uncharacterized protein n=1 Tax=Pedosphaera parvula (strain Ellin514) TaxID=320771 RepID=B9XD53_PEDPL|nr:hypothetical protein Cflav_PD5034 [Pedosphaera parvula Ellin514]